LSELSRASGLGKSSLYHHFPNGKEDMALAVIESAEAWLRHTVSAVASGDGSPRARLTRILSALDELYDGGRRSCVLGNLVLGGAKQPYHHRLSKAFDVWIAALAQLAVDAGVPRKKAQERAEDAVAGIQGALILSAGVDDLAPFRRRLRAIPDALFSGTAGA
jgi:AcrR family transcriptional regulator